MTRRDHIWTVLTALAAMIMPAPAIVGSRIEGAPRLKLTGKWGSGDPVNLTRILIAVLDQALEPLNPSEISSLPREIRVRRDRIGPMAVYRGKPGRSPVHILLSATDRYWAQYIYQFGHELGHIFCNFRRADREYNKFQWLEESISGAVSLMSLEGMARNWPLPPGHPGHDFGETLWPYLDERRMTYLSMGEVKKPRDWYLRHAGQLASMKGLYELNRPFAVWLFEHFRDDPSLFPSIRYLNLSSNDQSASLTEHLLRWKRNCLPGRDQLPALLLRRFGDVP